MDWFTGIAVFLTIWWLVLFVTLPLGARSQDEAGAVIPGTEPGAPVVAGMKRKLLLTTGIAIGVWLILAGVIASGLVSLERPLGTLVPPVPASQPVR